MVGTPVAKPVATRLIVRQRSRESMNQISFDASQTPPTAFRYTEDILNRLRGRIALVGNATPKRAYGKLIDSYDTVIRFNNFKLAGFEELVGTRTDLRCTTGWHDIEARPGLIEFSPFTADARESGNLAAFNKTNHRPVVAARLDIHPFISETPNPSCGLALVQLLHQLGIEADPFGFDGFQTSHYWNAGQAVETSHSRRELDILLERTNVTLIGETYPYAELYEFCHREHPEYDDNVGVELFKRLNKTVRGKKILEFGAGNGGLSALMESMGNEVTAYEISSHAFNKIKCSHKVQDSAVGLPFQQTRHDLFVSVDVLEHLTENDIRLVLREAGRLCSEIFLAVSTRPSGLLGPRGENLHLTVRNAEWWVEQVSRWFDVRAYAGYGQGQLVLEGALKNRAALVYEINSQTTAAKPTGDFALPADYVSRAKPEYFEDAVTEATGIVWQPEVYPYAGWLAHQFGCRRIVDVGCGRAGKLVAMSPEFEIMGLDFGSNLAYCCTHFPRGEWVDVDFDKLDPWPLEATALENSVLICADVIEHLRDPRPLLRQLKRCLEHAPAVVLSTPERELTRGVRHAGPPDNRAHTREWSLDEFVALLHSEGLNVDYAGLTPSNDREPQRKTILCVVSNSKTPVAIRWAITHKLDNKENPERVYHKVLAEQNDEHGFIPHRPCAKTASALPAPSDFEKRMAKANETLLFGGALEALGLFQQLLTEGHEKAVVFWGMARACLALGDVNSTKLACDCVLALDANHREALELLTQLNGEAPAAVGTTQPTPTLKAREAGWSFCIITNGKRPEKLNASIASIRALNIPNCEILVGGEVPAELVSGVTVVPVVDAARNGRLGEMRNRLTEQARYDHLVVADDDLLFHADFHSGLQQFGDAWDVLCVRFLNPDGTRFWDWATHGGEYGHQLLDYTETDPYVYVTGGLCVLKGHVSDTVKWDEGRGFYQGEDVDFSARLRSAGITPRFNIHSTVTHDDDRYSQHGCVVIRENLEIKRSVRWCAPIFNPSGYASEAINFMVPLKDRLDLGIYHHNNLYSDKFVAGLAETERETLFALRDRFAEIKNGIVISHNPANGFLRLPDADYHIGRTMFETDTIPAGWAQACNRMDEIWVPSQFNVETFVAAGVERDKLVVIPGAADEHFFDPKKHQPLTLPNRAKFNFLSIFEWSSRKGWDVLLAAYAREFSASDDVCLYLRTYLFGKPDADPRAAIERRVNDFIATLNLGDKALPRIEILADQVPSDKLPALYLAADCLVMPGRGEGWGRPHHEAMLMERPVIATNWSSNVEFMAPEHSYLIDYELVEAKHLEPELWHYRGHRWANPSETHLRQLMRQVQTNPAEAQVKGRAARAHMVKHYGRDVVATKVLRRLSAIEEKLTSNYRSIPFTPKAKTLRKPKQMPVVVWDGSYLDFGSLSHVNRELTSRVESKRHVRLQRVGRNPLPGSASERPELQRLARQLTAQAPRNATITVRHAWPPNMTAPESGAVVVMQPWEFGVLPADWVKALEQVDEVWANSTYVRRVYVESGVDPAKIKLLPLGIDPEQFKPGIEPLPLATNKKFKFLFVGGTIQRKGSDLLLQAYLETFTAADDVCLVIKDFGGQSVYAGQTLEQQIRAAQKFPNAPEILYLNNELPAADLPRLYVACDCLAHPYRGEGFGLPVLEAMACALPVIVTRGGSTDDFTNDDLAYRLNAQRTTLGHDVGGMKLMQAGWWLEPNFEELKQTLRAIAANLELAREKGQRASEYVRREWTWERSARVTDELLLDLAARREQAAEALAARRTRKAPAIKLPAAALCGDLNRSRQAYQHQQWQAAWELTLNAIHERPFHPEGWLMLSDIALAAGDLTKARVCAEEAVRLTPRWKETKKRISALSGKKSTTELTWATLPAKQSEPRVSVCLITKNEEKFLAQCLTSVRELATQIVVMDTGSTDRTVEIAKSFGAEVRTIQWGEDFSAARNAALEHVRGDWVLVLDADEELLPDSIAKIREEIRSTEAMAYRLPIIDIGKEDEGHSYIPRLFRNAPGLFYICRVHEQVFSSVETRRLQWNLENRLSKGTVRHHGYQEAVVKSRDKVARNLRLLELAVEEWPNEPNLLMSLGLELTRSGQLGAGIEQYAEAFYILSQKPAAEVAPELRETLLSQFTTQLMANRQFGDIVQVLNSLLAKSGSGLTASHHFTMGLALQELKHYAPAAEAFRRCLATRHQPTHAPINAEIRKAGPRHCLAACLAQLGKEAEARTEYQKARAEAPESIVVAFDFAQFELKHQHPVEALNLLHAVVTQDPQREEAWRLGGQIALRQKEFYEVAADWTAEAVQQHPQSKVLWRQRATALLINQKIEDALIAWQKPGVQGDVASRAALILCELANEVIPAPLEAKQEEAVSREFIQWYRHLIAAEAGEVIGALHTQLARLQAVLPSAAGAIMAVLHEVELSAA